MHYLWWQHGIIYQIYPRSFMDSNQDGIGDLSGITSKLDYLKWLGIDAIWLSPIYPSPMADFGYDISDYTDIHPLFGSMQEFDELLTEAHARSMKIILDLVPNHTSSAHPWFLESRASRDNPKRDWYIWHDPKPDGSPPNNWLSVFGGSAWEFDEASGQYYYHAFLKEQPDLNWRHPEVEQAMLNIMRFWLDKGVDGFRVDVMWHIIKDALFRDNPLNPHFNADKEMPYNALLPAYSTDQPEVHDYVARMRKLLNEYNERVLIGEIYLPIDKLVTYYGEQGSGVHMPFNFQLIVLPWDAQELFAAITLYEASLPPDGWPNWVIGNHDNKRIASRIGIEQARIAALLLLTLRGTPTLYYGDELGMLDGEIPPELIVDPQAKNQHNLAPSRDPARTPMQWDETLHAGFTNGNPWLPISTNYPECNAKMQRDQPASMLSFYRQLIALRKDETALQTGAYIPVGVQANAFAYIRQDEDRQFLIVVNLSTIPAIFTLDNPFSGYLILSTHPEREHKLIEHTIELMGNEGVVIKLNNN